MSQEIKEIVLTGGPCAGKTTAKNYLAEKLREQGFRAFLVPEVATMAIAGGVTDIRRLREENNPKYFEVQKQMLFLQMALRQHFLVLAKIFSGEKCIIIYDRGPMDNKAYVRENEFEAIMAELRLNFYDVRDSFDGIIHLVTAANGAEEFYTLVNNKARYENLEEARLADEKTLQVWLGHPHLRIIDNSTNFKEKMHRALKAASRILGIPVPLEIERKFLLAKVPDLTIKELAEAQKIYIEQIYLTPNKTGEETRLRKRNQDGFSVYYLTHKIPVSATTRQEIEKDISAADYLELQKRQIPNSSIIKKNRYCFVWQNQYFELDIFVKPKRKPQLEIELTEENDSLTLPPFLDIKKEITGDPKYTNHTLATRKRK